MERLVLQSPQKVIEAIKSGAKIAVFALDEANNPKSMLSDINLRISPYSARENEMLTAAVKFIGKYYNKDIRLKTLAKLCDISPAYFSRIFSETFGKGPNAYVRDVRLEQACRLLADTDRSAVSIANEVGYPDCGYFYKLFKKKYGITPLQFRTETLNRL